MQGLILILARSLTMNTLKKLAMTLAFGAVALLFTACGSSEPKDVAVEFVENVYKGKGDNLLKYVYLSEKDENTAGVKEMAEGKLKAAAGQAAQKAEDAGGLKSVEVVSEEIKENAATINLRINFGNGNEDSERVRLIKDKDEWKIKL